MSKISINKKNLFLLCLSLMCAVEKVSAMNEGGENQNAENNSWSQYAWKLPGRAIEGATNAGKYVLWDLPGQALEGATNAGKYVLSFPGWAWNSMRGDANPTDVEKNDRVRRRAGLRDKPDVNYRPYL